MLPQDTVTWLVAGAILAGFLALVLLLAIQTRRLRTWKRAHRLVTGDYRQLRERLRAALGEPLGEDDRALLEEVAEELRGCLVGFDDDVLLFDAEAVHVATIPRPVLEIEYPDRLVTLSLAIEHYADEEAEAQA